MGKAQEAEQGGVAHAGLHCPPLQLHLLPAQSILQQNHWECFGTVQRPTDVCNKEQKIVLLLDEATSIFLHLIPQEAE